jgi:hypothetical protein
MPVERVTSHDGRMWAAKYSKGWTVFHVTEGLVVRNLTYVRAMCRIGRRDLVPDIR